MFEIRKKGLVYWTRECYLCCLCCVIELIVLLSLMSLSMGLLMILLMSWIHISALEGRPTALNMTQMNMEGMQTPSRRREYNDSADEDFKDENL